MKERTADLLLVGCLLALGCLPLLYGAPPGGPAWAEISVDGRLVRRIPLEGTHETFSVAGRGGANTIRVEDGAVSVTDADCPDRICVRAAPIRHPGEAIACVPHQVLVEIRQGEQEDAPVDIGASPKAKTAGMP